jgi:hypothetical protein
MAEKKRSAADKAKELVKKAKKSASSTVRTAADINADGKVDKEDARIAAGWAKKKAAVLGGKASELAKSATRTDLGKDVTAGAAIGAVAAVPLPVIGPLAGAAVGAGVGVYRNLKKKRTPSPK